MFPTFLRSFPVPTAVYFYHSFLVKKTRSTSPLFSRGHARTLKSLVELLVDCDSVTRYRCAKMLRMALKEPIKTIKGIWHFFGCDDKIYKPWKGLVSYLLKRQIDLTFWALCSDFI